MMYKDLIERYNVDKEYVLRYLIKQLGKSVTKIFSAPKIARELSSQNISVSKPSLYNYLSYLENIYFAYPLQQQGRQRGAKKYYLHDLGYLTLREKEAR